MSSKPLAAFSAPGQLSPAATKSILRTIVISLILDLLSFTLILPLFPRLLDYYREVESASPHPTMLTSILAQLNAYKATFSKPISSRFDVVLLGGALGSLYSLLQALAAPFFGVMSDRYGRRSVLLLSMLGNIASVVIWLVAKDFRMFMLSRLVAGLSEANVQICQAIAADVSSEENRNRTMALIGVVFCIAFTFGPIMGAYVAGKTITLQNPFAATALLSLGLLVAETLYLYVKLPETRPVKKKEAVDSSNGGAAVAVKEVKGKETSKVVGGSFSMLIFTQFLFLLIFSGMESSLTFMTFDLFSYTSKDSGKLLGFVGLTASLLQGSFTRRAPPHIVVRTGLISCTISFFILARLQTQKQLYLAAFFLGVSSATVVTGMASLTSLRFSGTEQGAKLGVLRSAGQVGRAMGPVLFCSLYWWAGGEVAYNTGACGMALVTALAWVGLGRSTVAVGSRKPNVGQPNGKEEVKAM